MFWTDRKRADGLTLTPWSRGRSLVSGMPPGSAVDTLCKTYVPITARTAGAAADNADKKKRNLYALLPNHKSVPIPPLCGGVHRPFRWWCLQIRPTSLSHGRTARDLAHSTDQPGDSARQRSQRGGYYFPSPNPKIHSANIILKLTTLATEWRLNQKCVFDIYRYTFYIITWRSSWIEIKVITWHKNLNLNYDNELRYSELLNIFFHSNSKY